VISAVSAISGLKGLTEGDVFLTNDDMHINRVSTTYVTLLYEFLAREGLDASSLLGPLPDERELPYTRVDVWRGMLERAQETVGGTAFGLRVGQGITPRHFGIVGYLGLASANLGEALTRTERYASLVYDVNPMHLEMEAGQLVLRWGVENGKPGQLVDETGIAAMVQLARDITGKTWPVERVCFVNPAPADITPYADFFAGEVWFDQPRTELRIPFTYLQQPLRQPDASLLALLDQQAEAMLGREAQRNEERSEGGVAGAGRADEYRRVLIRLLREGDASVEKLADSFHMSARTLQRKLSAQGIRYQPLLDGTRRMLAQEYLSDGRLSMTDIASLLGYSEQSAFNRAFKRWTGTSPARWQAG
jgi:AraC-like DNA-binding protein